MMWNGDVSTIKGQGRSEFSLTPFYCAHNLALMTIAGSVIDYLSTSFIKKPDTDDFGIV